MFFVTGLSAYFGLLGPPGSGKAELGKTLSEATGKTHLSVGHLLREEARKDTERSQLINQAILMGRLVASVSKTEECIINL